jgi:hypothetical protein
VRAWPSVLLGAVLAIGCSVSLVDPAGRACDATHPCAVPRVCSAEGLCVANADGGSPTPAFTSSAGTNIDPIGTFESGCAPWVWPDDVTVTASSVAHGGGGSCQFCGGASGDLSLDDNGFMNTPSPGTYHASAWVRLVDGHPPTVPGLLLRTVDHPNGRFEEVEKAAFNGPNARGNWQQLTVDLTVTKPAEILNVVVYGHDATCLLVDDVTVERLP